MPVHTCPSQGEPIIIDLTTETEPPDYEEGLSTGLLPEEGEGADVGMRSYVPSTPAPQAEPLLEPTPAPAPTPTPSPW